MNEQLDKMPKWCGIKPTIMRELGLRILKERKSAISLPAFLVLLKVALPV